MTWIGDLIIIVSQLMSGFQMVVEEKFLKGENGRKLLPSEFVVGCEGFFGAFMMSVIFVPLLMNVPEKWTGIYEDIPEGFQQLGDNGELFGVVFVYFCSIAFYNFFGLSIAGKLSAVHRTLVDACRTIVVWVVSISLYYTTSKAGGQDCTTEYEKNACFFLFYKYTPEYAPGVYYASGGSNINVFCFQPPTPRCCPLRVLHFPSRHLLKCASYTYIGVAFYTTGTEKIGMAYGRQFN